MVSTLFRDPQAWSSALTALGTLQPQAFGSLNRVETLDSVSTIIYSQFMPQKLSSNHEKNCLFEVNDTEDTEEIKTTL